ncbi:hypothetical protein EFJ21_01935 [Staphylococcus haemolyticus]|nr:hypothetical protein EFJ25_03000 [Staphylococcus haemolyticus]TPX85576.1 hypothetical protein EFJ21_01935 [Staphylococcus haemolyticus]
MALIGNLIGFIGGYYLHQFIMSTLPLNKLTIHLTKFCLSTVLTAVLTFIAMIIMAHKINKADMLSAFNSVR